MSDFGHRLREARERRGISLRHISDRTKISMPSLEALERSDASRLPGGIFARSFVRSYAIEIGLDPDATVRDFLERFGDEPRFAVAGSDVQAPVDAAESRSTNVVLKLLVAGLVAVGIILYFTLIRHGVDQQADPVPDSVRRTSGGVATVTAPQLPRVP